MYIFYDTEATGLDIDFTQLLQVAMVFADDDLNILSSKKSECRRLPWVIPSPGAMLITGFTPDDLKNTRTSHYGLMRDLAVWMQSQHWPLTFVGYNSLQFDEPALERNLAQNLLPHGMTTAQSPHNAGRNRRFDIFPLVKQLMVYYPGLLKLDIQNDFGKPSLTLMNVAQQNGVTLAAEDAHDAMNDIRATIGVAQLIMNGAPDLWQHALENMSSSAAAGAYMAKTPVFGYTDLSFGRSATVAATDMGGTADGQRRVVFDLSQDPTEYLDLSVEELARVMRRMFDRGNDKALPFRFVEVDQQPAVNPIGLVKHVVTDYDEKQAASRARKIAAAPDFQDKVAKALALVHRTKKDFNAAGQPPMIEQLYSQPVDPALAPRLEKWIEAFHAADWPRKAVMARSFATDFAAEITADPHLSRFGKYAGRVVFDNAPGTLTPAEQKQMMTYIAKRALTPDTKVGWMTVARARQELEKIEGERTAGKAKWAHVTDTDIRAIKLYYTALEKELAPYLPVAPQAPANANTPKPPDAAQPPKFG